MSSRRYSILAIGAVVLVLLIVFVGRRIYEVNAPLSRTDFKNPPQSHETPTPTPTKSGTDTPTPSVKTSSTPTISTTGMAPGTGTPPVTTTPAGLGTPISTPSYSGATQTAAAISASTTPTGSAQSSIPLTGKVDLAAALSSSKFDIPPEVAGHEKEWPLGNHDYSNSRVAIGSGINASNVANLKIAWSTTLSGTSEWGATSGNPIISNGVTYFQDLQANTYAVDLKSGSMLWKTLYGQQIFGPSGPGIGYGKIFVVSRIDRYSALDLKTGKEIWQWTTGQSDATGAFQPSVFGKRLYVTTQAASSGTGARVFHSYQGGSSGIVFQLDPETGQPGWHWQAVEQGFWGNPRYNSGGGLWFPPAIDINTGVSFWNTGNPSPVPGIKGFPNGSSRPGPNLYTDSQVALDHNTGKMLWYNQVKPHDLFNLDFQDSPMLATVKINGSDKDIVIGSGKLGVVYAFDRASGKTLWSTSVGEHKNDLLQALPLDMSTTWVSPGAWGGVETPMAYADGIAYVLTANLPSPYNATAYDADTPEQALNRSEGGTKYDQGNAEMLALDGATGKIIWDHKFDKVSFAGATVVNDLVFTATLDGMVYALNRQNGSVVWQWQGPGGTNSWPAVSGDTIVWGFGLGDDPAMVALSLSGNQPLVTPTPHQQRTPVQTPEH